MLLLRSMSVTVLARTLRDAGGLGLPLQNSHSIIDHGAAPPFPIEAAHNLLGHGIDDIYVVDFIHLLTRFELLRVPS
jgi:hypothetical protein